MTYEPRVVETVSITRATYKLPSGRAEALAKFLADQLSDEVEVRAKGDALQIIASDEDQQAVARLIELVLRKGKPAEKGSTDEPNWWPVPGLPGVRRP